jgi:hypothetical protein
MSDARENDDGSTMWGGCYEHEQPVDACSSCKWQLEKRFWASLPSLERFDIEETSTGYSGSHRDMVKNESGDWVRAEDFRAQLAQARAELERAKRERDEALTKLAAVGECIAVNGWVHIEKVQEALKVK